MMALVTMILLMTGALVLARMKKNLNKTFHDPHWMILEETEDEGYKWDDNKEEVKLLENEVDERFNELRNLK